MRLITEKFGALTVPDLIDLRFNSVFLRVIIALTIYVGCVGYLMTNFIAFGTIGEQILGLPYAISLIIGVLVLSLYVVLGGQLASIWTTSFQMVIMMLGSLVVFLIGLKLTGGFTNCFATIGNANPNMIKAWHPHGSYSFSMWLSFVILYSIGFLGQPHLITKFYTIKKIGLFKWAALIGAVSMSITCLIYSIGTTSRYLTLTGAMPEIAKQDSVVPIFFTTFCPPILGGIIIAAALAAVMSTADAFLVVASSALVRDIYQQVILGKLKNSASKLSPEKELMYARIATTFTVLIVCLLCIRPVDVITWIGAASWGIFAAVIGPVVFLGLRSKLVTKSGAIAGALVGFVISFGCYIGKTFGVIPKFFVLDYSVWAMIISTVVIVVLSFVTKKERNEIIAYVENNNLENIDNVSLGAKSII